MNKVLITNKERKKIDVSFKLNTTIAKTESVMRLLSKLNWSYNELHATIENKMLKFDHFMIEEKFEETED